jgi:hypothetical protein
VLENGLEQKGRKFILLIDQDSFKIIKETDGRLSQYSLGAKLSSTIILKHGLNMKKEP